MTTKELRKIAANAARSYLGKRVAFTSEPEDVFDVKSIKVIERKNLMPRYEFDDYGVDENAVTFILSVFYDEVNSKEAMNAICVPLTLNDKGEVGTCAVPFGCELTGADEEFSCEFYEKVIEIYNHIK